jgi:Rieske Fe-S protein
MERREFIKTTCLLCTAFSAELFLGTLASCAPYPVYETPMEKGKILIPVSIFDKASMHVIRAKNLGYDIALHKENDGSYTALLLRCTHASTPVKYTGNEFVCPLHGSTFDQEGRVKDGPAIRSLRKLETELSNDKIMILVN